MDWITLMRKAWFFRWTTVIHKCWIFWYCLKFSVRLMYRSIIHDWSKFTSLEANGFGELVHKLSKSTYGSGEYKSMLHQLKGTVLKHHYKHNRHHPEHYEGGYTDMALIDVVEMYIDWQASIKKHKDGDIHNSIKTNHERFGLSDDLVKILTNTANETSD